MNKGDTLRFVGMPKGIHYLANAIYRGSQDFGVIVAYSVKLEIPDVHGQEIITYYSETELQEDWQLA